MASFRWSGCTANNESFKQIEKNVRDLQMFDMLSSLFQIYIIWTVRLRAIQNAHRCNRHTYWYNMGDHWSQYIHVAVKMKRR